MSDGFGPAKVYNKDIHGDEFRLRILATNACDRNCSTHSCLNDFQKKPGGGSRHQGPDALYVSEFVAAQAIINYYKFMSGITQTPIIHISGGEPGLHKGLSSIVDRFDAIHTLSQMGNRFQFPRRLTINTNGLALKTLDPITRKAVHSFHIGVYAPPDGSILERVRGWDSFQTVLNRNTKERVKEIIAAVGPTGLPIKVFEDFFESPNFHAEYKEFILEQRAKYPAYQIDARFTGPQENRGKGCDSCTRKCITLKALWVFPDGSVSPCPQREGLRLELDHRRPGAWSDVMQWAYDFHKREGRRS